MWIAAVQQLQSYPTPEMFISRRNGELHEYGRAVLELESATFVMGQPVNSVDESNAGLSLFSMVVNGPYPLPQTDPANAALTLFSLVNVTAQPVPQSDPANAALTLFSLVNVAAQPYSTNDTIAAGFALQSMTVP